jgi:hypothetical protein
MRIRKEVPYPAWLTLKVTKDQRDAVEALADAYNISLAEAGRWVITTGIMGLKTEKIV